MFGKLKRKSKDQPTPTHQADYCPEPVYVIGDVHGCYDHLTVLLRKIEAHCEDNDITNAKLVFVGDLMDRGQKSRQVISLIMRLDEVFDEVICIMGNHEEFFLRVLDGDVHALKSWFQFGGMDTARSYGVENLGEYLFKPEAVVKRIQDKVPEAHHEFIANFRDAYKTGTYLCVHAGIKPGVAIEDQDPYDLRWIRDDFLSYKKPHPLTVVHGHTIVEEAEFHSNRIAIDTGVYEGNALTALFLYEDRQEIIEALPESPQPPSTN